MGFKGTLWDLKDPLLRNKNPLLRNKNPLLRNKNPLLRNRNPLGSKGTTGYHHDGYITGPLWDLKESLRHKSIPMELGNYIEQLLSEGWERKPGLMSLVAFGASDIHLCLYNDYVEQKEDNETFEEWQKKPLNTQGEKDSELIHFRNAYFQKS